MDGGGLPLRHPPRGAAAHRPLRRHVGACHPPRHADHRLRNSQRRNPAVVEGRADGAVRLPGLQLPALHRRHRRAGAHLRHLACAVPQRRGQGAAGPSAVLLLLGLPAGDRRQLRQAPRRGHDGLRQVQLDPAQRHPSCAVHPRAHAHPARRARHGLGRGLGHRHPHLRLHQPHRSGRGPREVGDADLRSHFPAHLRDRPRDRSSLP